MNINSFWQFSTAGNLVFGRGALDSVPDHLRRWNLKRPCIITDANLLRIPAIQSAIESWRGMVEHLTIFDEGEAEPRVEVADRAAQRAASEGADSVIGIGGGSNLDVAKIVATLLKHGGTPADYFGFGRIPGPIAPMIAIPTTSGTGSEVSHSAVLTDVQAQVKVSTLSPYLRPLVAIVDPSLTDGCPATITAHSGIDALVHAIEAMTNRPYLQIASGIQKAYEGSYSWTTLIATEAVRNIARYLVRAVETPGDTEARDGMAYAATLAGMAFSNSGVGLVHALEYPIGALTHCSHGEGNGLLLPHVMRFNLPMCAHALSIVASHFCHRPQEYCSAEDAVTAIVELQNRIGIRTRLRDLGLAFTDIGTVADKTLQIERMMQITARRPNRDDLIALLEAAY
jgi:alcohol dehydrogenase